MKTSSYEAIVIEILLKGKIKFIREKRFDDCRNGLYRFDFYLPEQNILLEIQGKQHYEFSKAFHKNRSDFTKAQERDRQKIRYCLTQNIPLYCIPYWDIDKLNNFEDLLKEEYLAKTIWHNDEAKRKYRS